MNAFVGSQSTQMVELAPTSPEVRQVQASNVSVRLVQYDAGDLFVFELQNLSPQPILVDRDAVEVVLPKPVGGGWLPIAPIVVRYVKL